MLEYPLLYLEHLSDRDLDLMGRVTGRQGSAAGLGAHLRAHPDQVEGLLAGPELYEAIFGTEGAVLELGVTPFLVFAVIVNRVARDLDDTAFVPEWVGSGQRLPVFGVDPLKRFIEEGLRRYFLIEFLASFTKVASGSVWVKTRRGYRRRRYSELDPVGLAEMVDALPSAQRAAGYRRLGDVSLFLSGVFPDHTTRNALGEIARGRLARSAGVSETSALGEADEVHFYEVVGAGWYERAVDSATGSVGVGPGHLRDVAEHFGDARRLLNYLSDRYLHRLDTGLMHPAAPH